MPIASRGLRWPAPAAGWICWYCSASHGILTLDNALPLNLCDWASAALIVALLTRNQLAYELGYFWGLGGTLQGVLTPTIYYDFPDPQFFFFFIQHGGVIAALLYLTLGTRHAARRWRRCRGWWWPAWPIWRWRRWRIGRWGSITASCAPSRWAPAC